MTQEERKELEFPVCEALVKPVLIAGVNREAFILNVTLCIIFVLALKLYVMSLFFLVIHLLLVKICKKDSQIINIFMKRYIKQKDYYYEG